MRCQICKSNEAEFEVDGALKVCANCKQRLSNEILLYCEICNAMAFIPKTKKNIDRIKFFVVAATADFWASNVIVPMNGCPHCVSFENSVFGERRKEVLEDVRNLP